MTTSIDATPPEAIGARTHRWSVHRRLGFGLLALVPSVLLFASLVGVLSVSLGLPMLVPTVLIYTHVATQLIVLGIYGRMLFGNRSLTPRGRFAWAVYFVCLAPAALVSYWYVHVWRAEGREEVRIRVGRLGHRPLSATSMT